MRSFKHSGDAGDIIYSLPVLRLTGGGVLSLSKAEFTRVRTNAATLQNLAPLLEAQPFVSRVELYRGQAVAFDLDLFRLIGNGKDNIAARHLRAFGLPEDAVQEPWLTAPVTEIAPVVVNVTHRYRNLNFPWREVIRRYKGHLVFVGTQDEHSNFVTSYGDIPYHPTKDLLELAAVINGSKLFLGNQSSPYAIAEALKKNTIQEVCLSIPNCIFRRPNAQYVPGARIELPNL